MEQFRPAPAIAADRALAESFRDGDDAAIRTIVTRFGPPVASFLAAHDAVSSTVDVFVQAWVESDEFDAGDDMGPWLRSIAAALVGPFEPAEQTDADDERWRLASATASFDGDAHAALRAFHVDHEELVADAARHELRLRRRLTHLGPGIDEALADSLVWERPRLDVADRVVDRIAAESESAAAPTGGAVPSWLSRSIRPALLGLGGAVLVLFVAIVVLSAASGSVDEPEFTVELTPTGLITEVEAGELTVTETDSGLALDIDAFTLPRRAGDQLYAVVLVLDDDSEIVAGSFNEGFGVDLTVGVDLSRVVELRVVAAGIVGESDDNDAVLKADFPRP